jgi:hypothetical protein
MMRPAIPFKVEDARALAWSFPVLRPYLARTEGVLDFDDAVATVGGDGAKAAAAFVLHLFNPTVSWRVGPLVLREALAKWDHEQLAAFAAWAGGES